MDLNEKKQLIKKHSPGSKILKNSSLAFLFGGTICLMGQFLLNLYEGFINDKKIAAAMVTVTMIARG